MNEAKKANMNAPVAQASLISAEDFEQLAREQAPFIGGLGACVERIEAGFTRVRLPFRQEFLRPGGTIAGPVLMGIADLTIYAVVLSMIGRVELAVTTNLNINFLRRPSPCDVLAEGRMLKLGKRLAVCEAHLYSYGQQQPVAHVTSTYSIPPRGADAA